MAVYRRNQKGLVTVFFTVASAVILGFVGLAIDTGFAYGDYRQAQLAADAGAISAAFEKHHGHSTDDLQKYGTSEIAAHGFTDGQDGVSVSINNPPTSGAYSGNSDFVEVEIQKTVNTFFLNIIGMDAFSYSVRSVANGIISSNACLYALGDDHEKALHVSSGSEIEANCGVNANSSHSSGLYVDSGSKIEADQVNVVGGAYVSGSTITPAANEGADPVSSLMATLTTPSVSYGACDYSGNSKGSGLYERYEIDSEIRTINPGSYCGGLFIKGTAEVTMNPGTYIMQGGGLVVDGSDAVLQGDGVFIYNTCAVSDCSSYGGSYSEEEFHPLDVKSSGTLNLASCSQASTTSCQADVDEEYQDMFWYTDKEAPESDTPQQDPVNKLSSSASATLAGTFFAGNQSLDISSNTDVKATNGVFISRYVQIASGSSLIISHDSSAPQGFSNGPYIRITLVE
ncbi:hypothetical protein GTG28_00125 [Vibrio sp. OCN044]|uniref:Putative Flp pilus-assembly TadG-like N-terminal domain-containing protein n=1 Tax=Vibrio tetraodonis subsp. pristinus TaxID=2695891 RepID=A0A6L8LWU1_9VIBR|nr:pilus assembly protein TadG-related protein [Vibrio tetraodonis]MYM57639.1 hypothetical protein [Vibrio tetraodonis subsp. pristinus]